MGPASKHFSHNSALGIRQMRERNFVKEGVTYQWVSVKKIERLDMARLVNDMANRRLKHASGFVILQSSLLLTLIQVFILLDQFWNGQRNRGVSFLSHDAMKVLHINGKHIRDYAVPVFLRFGEHGCCERDFRLFGLNVDRRMPLVRPFSCPRHGFIQRRTRHGVIRDIIILDDFKRVSYRPRQRFTRAEDLRGSHLHALLYVRLVDRKVNNRDWQ